MSYVFCFHHKIHHNPAKILSLFRASVCCFPKRCRFSSDVHVPSDPSEVFVPACEKEKLFLFSRPDELSLLAGYVNTVKTTAFSALLFTCAVIRIDTLKGGKTAARPVWRQNSESGC